MENLILITDALEYIEANLTENLKTDDLAQNLFCSKSTIEKLFKYATRTSIKDYTIRRRMSLAAKDIAADPDIAIIDLAVKYGYGSNEAFTRAFKNVWHATPSEYRNSPTRYELYPAFRFDYDLMEDETMKSKKKVDISELYDYIVDRKDCYFIGVDIQGLIPINDVAIEAGDIAILTALNRLADASGEDDIVFRVGGDEFVALTGSTEKEYAEKIVEEILSHNGEPIVYNGREIPLSLYATCYQLECKPLRYADLFSTMQKKLDLAKGKIK